MRSNEIKEKIDDYEDLLEEVNCKSKKSNKRSLKLLIVNAVMSLLFPIGLAIPRQNTLSDMVKVSPIKEVIADNIGWLGDILTTSPFLLLSLIGVMGGMLTCGYLVISNFGYGLMKKIANSRINSLNKKLRNTNSNSLENDYSKSLYKANEKQSKPVYQGYSYTNRRTSHQDNDVVKEDYYYKIVDNKLVRVRRKSNS